jgi:hypothetical protein
MNEGRSKWANTADGWLRYENSAVPFDVHVRPALVEGRWIIAELRLGRPEGITGGNLRQLRLDPVEAMLPRVIEDLGFAEETPEWFRDLARRRYSMKRGLRPPAKKPYPDKFYRDVADSYLACLEAATKPAPTLARFWDVPITSVHGWVKEARRRGFLPPGRKGKAG